MTIAEVSKKVSLSPNTLRYYERIGLIPEVKRTKSGIRNYTEKDLGFIELSKNMRNAGMSISSLIKYVKLYKKGASTIEARKQLLISQREVIKEKLNELQNSFEMITYKINNYDEVLKLREKAIVGEKIKTK
ncbi:MerR family transcriptional regulator [Brachyspira catarrhinii]|uniref:MerR family transcriptional regulator n=1 Tax=Brachyspira catarrhinii TaxID=2528966 RepID=A0ABY2TPT5_9SPIR|nr:MerR family transcriptional regulator [Brachyspira catarrhinii]TKZ30351.1 MerR family transcriptional regulator [Brachyspira catarrhinii]